MTLRLNLPWTGPEELAGVAEVLRSGHLTQGPRAAAFERRVADYVGTRHGFATSSCTTGLHLALVALGVRPGDEVVVPDFTFPATANAVVQQGARPVLVDIDLDTFCIDPGRLADALTDRTRAVLPVHAFGLVADMDAVNEVASGSGIPVLEDAACAIGGAYRGRRAGALATAGVFSFHPRKIITTGEGGMVTTDDDALAERLALLRVHGGVRGERYLSFLDAGFNYRLSDVNAAIGIAQMDRLATIVAGRVDRAGRLTHLVSGIPGVRPPIVPDYASPTFQSYVVLLDDALDRDRVIDLMRDRGVETTLGTYALHAQPFYRDLLGLGPADLPRSARAFQQTLTLPMYPQLTDDDLETVAGALAESVAAA